MVGRLVDSAGDDGERAAREKEKKKTGSQIAMSYGIIRSALGMFLGVATERSCPSVSARQGKGTSNLASYLASLPVRRPSSSSSSFTGPPQAATT